MRTQGVGMQDMVQPTKLNEVPPRLRSFARAQRQTMPRAEALFWEQVRGCRFEGHKFTRQVPIAPYIVDCLCNSARSVIELDGEPHETDARKIRDAKRDARLAQQGFQILRFPNDLGLGNLGAVMSRVDQTIAQRRGISSGKREGSPALDTQQVSP